MKRLFATLWHIVITFRNIIVNLIFFSLLALFVVMITSGEEKVIVPNQTALVLDLKGNIVEQKHYVDPMDAFLNEALGKQQQIPEILLTDVINVIDQARSDDRVTILVLRLQQLERVGLSKLQDIGQSLAAFRDSGKRIVAIGDVYTQAQYYLASHADDIWLNKNGYLLLDGFGRYQLYFKSALDKLSISQHIFRVGTFKSAVEPYMRDDMSKEAKLANQVWLDDLWTQYKQDVANQRGIEFTNFDETVEALLTKFKASNGSFAEYALNNNWVDALKTRDEMRSALIAMVGKNKDGDSFKQINFKSYLASMQPEIPFQSAKGKVGIVVAKGEIVDGYKAPGIIGGDSTARLLREARFDDSVKAVVLRVDSPGGSAYASEIIRHEVDLLQEAGKPVVASMGSVAASGGYWISTSADKIYASPTTITGSIGIFGLFMTFENSLSKLGVHTDGVGTTDFAGFGITRQLTDGMAEVIQTSINRGYQDFISLVAEHRNMTVEQVDKIAQGRVWSGSKAKELGLVDELGGLEQAVMAAAQLAELSDYDEKLIEQELSAQDKLLQNLLGSSAALLAKPFVAQPDPTMSLINKITKEITRFEHFNDPQGMYSFCLTCDAF